MYETPVLVENVLSEKSCEDLCDRIVSSLGDIALVDLQCQKRSTASQSISSEIYECTLNQAFQLMMQSSHEKSFFCFCEGLLEDDSSTSSSVQNKLFKIRKELKESKESLFSSISEDLFNYFDSDTTKNNKKIKAPSDCVILAGEGATSTLHRDPFEWTGTSLCLEGTKVWRFVSPPHVKKIFSERENGKEIDFGNNDDCSSGVQDIDEFLLSYRLASMAWEGEEDGVDDLTISAGWQSQYSLFASRAEGKVIPSAEEFAYMEMGEKLDVLESLANNLSVLIPSSDLLSEHNEKNGKFEAEIHTVVQKPGDLLIIPAYWWHQTCALEPSLAIASQRVGYSDSTLERDSLRLVQHILNNLAESEGKKNVGNGEIKQRREDLLHDLEFFVSSSSLSSSLSSSGPKSAQELVDKLFEYIDICR
eukprot:CAMPEP_0178949786 /NCGR_PEP_ID=MMETSP0789-20121207/6263_1 /TAXON_ID=3005 /ORGANISM="Rhizosolenia setigera, Strain CCMP 1694" /LENGTH=419 /DNA_ID=CAMNT_0020630385 /DNA_START=237 /DNA_END=1496 /DNA_ORIENTATION=-